MAMIKTYGLTHIALLVNDAQRSFDFYHKIFGIREMYRSEGFIQAQTPHTHDILVFEEVSEDRGHRSNILHFGFRLIRDEDINDIVKEIEAAGGKISSRGEFCPGEPYVFFSDPDGNEVEVWYEKLPLEQTTFI